jgi:DNA-binding MarR family transcriptional regulator
MHQETTGQKGRPEERGNHNQAEAMMSVLEESISLFLRVRAVLEDIHGHSEISGSMRGVMRDLKHQGPMTVPQMARQRPVSRQHIQAIVNDLQRVGLVILVENPRHKRSRLVQLTQTGERALDEIIEREHRVLNAIDPPVSIPEMKRADDTLKQIRTMLESPVWRQTVRDVL